MAQVAIYGVVVYSMMGFEWTVSKFFLNTFFMFITVLLFIYYGIMIVAVSPNQAAAAVLSSVFYTMWNLFSGFIIPRPVTLIPPLSSNIFLAFSSVYMIPRILQLAEDYCMVEMVCLGVPGVMELVGNGCFTVWRLADQVRVRRNSGSVNGRLLWV